MGKFEPRTKAPDYDNPNYPHGGASEGQCTYGVYYRCKELGWAAPCHYYSGVPGYGNAKDWPANIEPQWENHYVSKEPNYIPVPGDIIVFNGNYGHVAFIEYVENADNNNYRISQWNMNSDAQYTSDIWHLGDRIYGKKIPTGPVLAYMHYKLNYVIDPVGPNLAVDQIEVVDSKVYLRSGPGKVNPDLGFAIPGYYNVFSFTDNVVDGYRWCKVSIDEPIYIAVIEDAAIYHKALNTDTEIEDLRKIIKQLQDENSSLKLDADGYRSLLKTIRVCTEAVADE